MVTIRLARGGRVKKPFYSIVAADSRMPRDGRFLQKLGRYDPLSAQVLKDVDVASIRVWVNKGAVVSQTVASLLKKNGMGLSQKDGNE